MSQTSYGGLHVAANTTAFNCPPTTGAAYTTGWAAMAPSLHGDGGVTVVTATGRLVLTPGVYAVDFNASMEGEFTSGTSGDAVGKVTAQLARGGTVIAGTKSIVHTDDEGEPKTMHISALVEITESQRVAGTNYLQVYLIGGDASGNDVIITEAQFRAIKVR